MAHHCLWILYLGTSVQRVILLGRNGRTKSGKITRSKVIDWKCSYEDIWSYILLFNKELVLGGAAIAQWIRLRLPSCHPGFESQAHHLHFFQFTLFKLYICHLNWNVNRTKINKKEARIGPFLKKQSRNLYLVYNKKPECRYIKVILYRLNKWVYERYA